jgi:hypothetical protein
MKADIVSGAILPDYELTEPAAEPGLVILKIYNRIGSLDCRPSKVPARICERYRRSAARTGTSRVGNRKQPGNGVKETAFTPSAKAMPKWSESGTCHG